ncbi:hypothetical protein, partial [Sagittula salina]
RNRLRLLFGGRRYAFTGGAEVLFGARNGLEETQGCGDFGSGRDKSEALTGGRAANLGRICSAFVSTLFEIAGI